MANTTTDNSALRFLVSGLFCLVFGTGFTLTLSSAFEFIPPWLSLEAIFSVCHLILHLCVTAVQGKGRALRTVSRLYQSVNTVSVLCSCITDTYISPVRHPCPRFLPAFRRVSWIDVCKLEHRNNKSRPSVVTHFQLAVSQKS